MNNSQGFSNALNFMKPLVAERLDLFGTTNTEHKDSGRTMIKLGGQINCPSPNLLLITLVSKLRNRNSITKLSNLLPNARKGV